jgi:acetyltransferase-like isoleucine patch superfamily enzyme
MKWMRELNRFCSYFYYEIAKEKWRHFVKCYQIQAEYGARVSLNSVLTGPRNHLHVGTGSVIGEFCNFRFKEEEIFIGESVYFGQYVTVLTRLHIYEKRMIPIAEQGHFGGKVVIESDAWIGSYSMILPGVTIGRGAVICAYALVARDVAPYSVVAGQPARVIKERLA